MVRQVADFVDSDKDVDCDSDDTDSKMPDMEITEDDSGEESNNFDCDDDNNWRLCSCDDNDFRHHSFAKQNAGAYFPTLPENQYKCFQNCFTDEILSKFVAASNTFATITISGKIFSKNSV